MLFKLFKSFFMDKIETISPENAAQLMKEPNVYLFDIRRIEHYNELFAPDSIHYTEAKFNELSKNFNDDTICIFMCYSGVSSRAITLKHAEQGYKCYSLQGGFAGWVRAGLPTDK